jgi:hypothetical protein
MGLIWKVRAREFDSWGEKVCLVMKFCNYHILKLEMTIKRPNYECVCCFISISLLILPAEDKRPEIIPTRDSEAKRRYNREGIGELTDR